MKLLPRPQDERYLLADQFRDYADVTTIHGIKYTCEPGRAAVEK